MRPRFLGALAYKSAVDTGDMGFSTAVESLLDAANAAAMATVLGLGTADSVRHASLGLGMAVNALSRLAVDSNNLTTGEIASYLQAASFANIRGIFLHAGNSGGYGSFGGLQIASQAANNTNGGAGSIHLLTGTANSGSNSTDATLAKRLSIMGVTGNVGIGVSSFGTNGVTVLGIATGTEPSTGVADSIQIGSVDLSAGNTIPYIRTEGTGIISTGTPAADAGSIAIKINGTVRYIPYATSPAA